MQKKRIIIVGGVAGGAAAATRARRLSEDAEIIMFERGEHISIATCGLPYHVGGVIADRRDLLVQTPEGLRNRYRIDVRTRSEVVSIDREKKEVVVRDLRNGREYVEAYDGLILSPGASPVRPPIPGADLPGVLVLRNISDMDKLNAVLGRSDTKSALIVGGGYVGLEMAEALVRRGLKVTLVELTEQVMGIMDPEMAVPIHQELRKHGVDLRLGACVTEYVEKGGRIEARLSTGESLCVEFVLLAVGVKPEVELAGKAGLEIGKLGGIVVDDMLRTSDENIYAVGDAIEVRNFVTEGAAVIPLAGPAARQGRIAADNLLGRTSIYDKTQGTAICKIFDLTVGMTGMSEKGLKREGFPHEKVYVHPVNHVGYYPGASPISLKLLFDPRDGGVLGAQAVGFEGVDKRIDVIAVSIRAGLTVFDLEEMELCYAPPYGAAKDVVNYAGFVAGNVIRGDVGICHVTDITKAGNGQILLDVRTPTETTKGTIPGAVVIPLDELRDRLGELPKGKEILTYCQVGLRGYLACRILMQNGFKCRNLSGGYKTYLMFAR